MARSADRRAAAPAGAHGLAAPAGAPALVAPALVAATAVAGAAAVVAAAVAVGLLGACAAAVPWAAPGPVATPPEADSYVVMVSVDGMHPRFLERVATPAFDRIARAGVRAESLIPVYPSRTFPNHYSMATGLYPARHGLVDNAFWDPGLRAGYRIDDRSAVRDGRFYGGEPIWATAARQGVSSAAYYWVGTEAPVGGVQPETFRYYDGSVPNEARVDTVLQWLGRPPARRPRLVLLYFSEPDGTAHAHGPDAPGVDAAVAAVDGALGRLLDGLEALAIGDRVNLIVLSDHGMEEIPAGNVVHLEEVVDLRGVRVVYNGTQAALHFGGDAARRDGVVGALRQRLAHATVFLRDETPEHWRYRHNDRVGDVLVVTDPGWLIRGGTARPWAGGGMHGWDPRHPAMQGIFLAAGPAFRAGATVPAFENIHVHPLVARLLGIEAAAGIDGRLEPVTPLLRDGDCSPSRVRGCGG